MKKTPFRVYFDCIFSCHGLYPTTRFNVFGACDTHQGYRQKILLFQYEESSKLKVSSKIYQSKKLLKTVSPQGML